MSDSGEERQDQTATEVGLEYHVDAKGCLVYFSPGWDAQARAGGAPQLVAERILGQPLLDFISDPTTAQVHELLMKKARASASEVAVELRCDTQSRRQRLRLVITPEGPLLRYTCQLLSQVARPAVALLDVEAPHAGPPISMCSWCKRVLTAGRWVEVEAAVRALGLFEQASVPRVTHGICEECLERYSKGL